MTFTRSTIRPRGRPQCASHATRAPAIAALAAAALLAACADTSSFGDDAAVPPDSKAVQGDRPFVFPDVGPLPDLGNVPGTMRMYAHSKGELFSLAPVTLNLSKVGDFHPDAPDINDLAIAPTGEMYALANNELFQVDPTTAKLTKITDVDGKGNVALSFDTAGKRLLASDKVGTLRHIQHTGPRAGDVDVVGDYGNGQVSAGDLVAIADGTLFDTTQAGQGATAADNNLVIVDDKTGQAHRLCSVGHGLIWGLAFWKGVIYGFSRDGKLLSIKLKKDELTNKWVDCTASLVRTYQHAFWGAAVTPLAPIK